MKNEFDKNPTGNPITQVHIAEFNQLREEINVYHDHQKEEIYFAMIVLGGVFAALLSQDFISYYLEIFLVFPFIFSSLALAYADRTVRILRVATYIHQHLRENLINNLGTREVMQWEVFKKHRAVTRRQALESIDPICIQRKIWLWFKRHTPNLELMLDVMRVAQFVAPSILCILLFSLMYNGTWDVLHLIIVTVSTVVAVTPIYFFIKSEETSGISLRSGGADLVEWEENWR